MYFKDAFEIGDVFGRLQLRPRMLRWISIGVAGGPSPETLWPPFCSQPKLQLRSLSLLFERSKENVRRSSDIRLGAVNTDLPRNALDTSFPEV